MKYACLKECYCLITGRVEVYVTVLLNGLIAALVMVSRNMPTEILLHGLFADAAPRARTP